MKTSQARRTLVALTSLILASPLAPWGEAQQASPSPPRSAPSPTSAPGTPAAVPAGSPAGTPEKVVLKVGDEEFTQAQLDFLFSNLNPQSQQAVATQGRRPVGEQYALMLLLSQQAVKDHLDSSPAFRQQVELQRHQILAQAEYSRLMSQTTISPEEIGQYYSSHAAEFDEAQVRQVVVRKRPEGAKEGTPGLAKEEARARIESIRKALAAGTDPKQVAQEFKSANDVVIDAEPRPFRHGQLLASLDKVAFELKDGQLSEPVDTPQALVLLHVVGHRHAELKQVSGGIENKLRQQKLEGAVADLRKKITVWMDDDYFKAPQAIERPQLTTVPERGTQP